MKNVCALDPVVFPGQGFGCDPVLISSIGVGAMKKEQSNDIGVAVCSSKVKRGGISGAYNGGRRVPVFIAEIAPGYSSGVHISPMFDELLHHLWMAACSRCVDGQNAVEDRVDGLAML